MKNHQSTRNATRRQGSKKLSVKQVNEVFKQLSLPTTVIPLQKNIEPFKQFSLLKHVDMVVGINTAEVVNAKLD